ncbi:MerR family transcriptional regulator [Oceanobacillus sp. CAU 1775]
MNIKLFSLKTGIPESTLRYYETKKLLIPERNKENGYRLYRDEQIQTAKLIASLRKADISIDEIQNYLQANKSEQLEMKRNWIKLLKQKKQQLDVGIQYLEASQQEVPVYLFEKAAEAVIWFQAEAKPGDFKEIMLKRRNEIVEQNFSIDNVYLRTTSATVSLVKAEIGFAVRGNVINQYFPEGVRVQEPAVLCVAQPFGGKFSNIVSAYRKLFSYCMENNWIPAGPVFEWYRGSELEKMDLVIPILKMEGEYAEN